MAVSIVSKSNIAELYSPHSSVARRYMRFYESPSVSAGFPSPATDYIENALDLNEYLAKNKPSTFLARVAGVSMIGAGIYDRDIVAVDRSIEGVVGEIVVATLDDDLLIKWLERIDGRLAMVSDHPTIVYPHRYFDEAQQSTVWGCVTGLVRRFPKGRRRS